MWKTPEEVIPEHVPDKSAIGHFDQQIYRAKDSLLPKNISVWVYVFSLLYIDQQPK